MTNKKQVDTCGHPKNQSKIVHCPIIYALLKSEVGDLVFCYSLQEVKSIGVVKRKAIKGSQPSDLSNYGWEEAGYLVGWIILILKFL